MQKLRSPLYYVGDKYKIVEQICIHFPDNIHRFIEPFVGGGSVFMNVRAKQYILNDIDTYIIKLHRFLISYANKEREFFTQLDKVIIKYGLSYSYKHDVIPLELKQEFVKTYYAEYNKKGFLALRKDFNSDKNNLMMLYVLLIYGFNRFLRFNAQGDFNLPVGNVDMNKGVVSTLINYFAFTKSKNLDWHNKDFRFFLEYVQCDKNDFIYLDPPYLISASEYNKMWNLSLERHLLELLDDLHNKNVKWAISNVTHYKKRVNEIFLHWSLKYKTHYISSNYISYHDNSNKKPVEVLITNY